jgi:hypothetical protein
MKRKHGILIGFAVLLLAAIVTFAGCPIDDSPGDEDIPNGNLGSTLTISSEQVYTETRNNGQVSYIPLSEDKTVTVSGVTLGSTDKAEIKGGKLDVLISAAPSGSQLSDITDFTDDLDGYVNVTQSGAKYAILSLSIDDNNSLTKMEDNSSTAEMVS